MTACIILYFLFSLFSDSHLCPSLPPLCQLDNAWGANLVTSTLFIVTPIPHCFTPPSPQLDNNGAQNDGKFRPQPPPRAATCNIHILTSGSPTKLPSWIKRVWWLWEAIKSYEGGDFESQEQWLVQSGNLKLSKSGWWPNSKLKIERIRMKYMVDIALVALAEKHTN